MFLAAQFLDVLWPMFILLGIERVHIEPAKDPFLTLQFSYYPFSHSLAASIVWSILFAIVYYVVRKNKKGAILLACLVFSHWVLDFVTHVPDLALAPGTSVKVGLGMWYSVALTVIVEVLIFAIGAWLYFSSTTAKKLRGKLAFWGLVVFLVFAYVANLFSPPPASVTALGVAGLGQWLIIAWAYWIDRNRVPAVAS